MALFSDVKDPNELSVCCLGGEVLVQKDLVAGRLRSGLYTAAGTCDAVGQLPKLSLFEVIPRAVAGEAHRHPGVVELAR